MISKSIKCLKGIGENRARLFNKLGIDTVYALLRFYPRDWRDYSDITKIASAAADSTSAFKCKVMTAPKENYIRKNMVLYKFSATDGTGVIDVTLFNNKFLANRIVKGNTYVFYGKISGYGVNRSMSSPEIIESGKAGITPIYSLTSGLYQSTVRNAVKGALEMPLPEDPIPDFIRRKYGLCDLEFALKNIHFPVSRSALETAKKRLVFEELLLFRMGIAVMRSANLKTSGLSLNASYMDEFKKLLPFKLTDSQEKVIKECETDMLSKKQMNRLIEGDVGSGKTAVAAALMYSAVRSGIQCAMMAPTEILAEQHCNTLKNLFRKTDINICLLAGSLTAKQKQAAKQRLKEGQIDIAVGTQALIQGDVEFKNLGLVVTDEQHRFGVKQRTALINKGKNAHILVMSATPIPRTLALIMCGDLDISIIDSLPKGRIPIDTYCVNSALRQRIYNFIKKHLDAGMQAYIVCPAIEEGENGLIAAKEYYAELKKKVFNEYNIGLLHGKQSSKEKDAVMREFSDGKIQLLVSTTVIEVGVDVPNATVMVIENAERFGLSQLHQLRGRVGRGNKKSTCVLVTENKDPKKNERLNVMTKISNGFEIAEYDLKFRGPGDFLGDRQHGLPVFKIADLSCNLEELKSAGDAAKEILEADPSLTSAENRALFNEVKQLFKDDIGIN